MQYNFDRAVDFVLDEEGDLSVDPHDPGKTTKFGISQRAYPHLDIKSLTAQEAIAIYRTDYFEQICGDRLPAGIDLMLFDAAVNQGVRAATQLFQQACHVKVDGIIGPVTLRASYEEGVLPALATLRALRYIGNPLFNRYGQGWISRLMRCMELSVLWESEKR